MRCSLIIFFFVFSVLQVNLAQEKYRNTSLSPLDRALDLTRLLTLPEKVSLMMDNSVAVDRLGIKGYNWWNEALHGVARAGLATVFPQPVGMAASFDPVLLHRVFELVSDEARAKSTQFATKGFLNRYQGLTIWTPTVNIFRDPRWGRGMETYGEDPYLMSIMGVAAVKGLQGPDTARYDKLHACAKHFAVHSGPEWNRHSFNAANISLRDLRETYLPAFEALVRDAKVKQVMCAYNRFEGEPCCANRQLLISILREEWNYDGIVVADCGAIADFYKTNAHATHPDAATASADAVRIGTDLDCGSSYKALIQSVEKGLISEKEIDVSVVRLLKARFELGEMDDPSLVSWTKIPYSVVASADHAQVALGMARKSMTLLHNRNGTLPLKRGGQIIAVMGPNANDSVMQWGNYHGTPQRTITILEGIRNLMGENDSLIYEKGCDLVERTLFQSEFNQCRYQGKKGFGAKYWNNPDRLGDPVVSNHISDPFRFSTTGATVFAPGVNLTNFSASYNTTFTPNESGEIIFDFYINGILKIFVNNQETRFMRQNHGSRSMTWKMKVVAGQSYDLQLDYSYGMGDAQLNFDLGFKRDIDFQQSLKRVQEADVVIFVGGISPNLEGEEMGVNLAGFRGGDRTEIELPAVQRELIKALHHAGKKVIFVNCSGSAVAMGPEIDHCDAILQAWYPGQEGGTAVAEVIFGDYNPAGRLPITIYRNLSQLPDFEDYSMEGRTYRYMKEQPLFPFGYGLSYTHFGYAKPRINQKVIHTGKALEVTVSVKNKGKRDGEEVVQVYLRKKGDDAGPLKTLRAFQRVPIKAGKTTRVSFTLTPGQLVWWDEETGRMKMQPGDYEILIGGSSDNKALTSVGFSIAKSQ